MSLDNQILQSLLIIAGIGQIVLALGSIAIPRVLKWKEEVVKLRPLIRQLFWTYASFILMANFSFGLLSLVLPKSLMDGSALAACVTGFIGFYWLTRIVFQFAYFDRKDMPKGKMYTLAEFVLVGGFFYFLVTYGLAFYHNVQ